MNLVHSSLLLSIADRPQCVSEVVRVSSKLRASDVAYHFLGVSGVGAAGCISTANNHDTFFTGACPLPLLPTSTSHSFAEDPTLFMVGLHAASARILTKLSRPSAHAALSRR